MKALTSACIAVAMLFTTRALQAQTTDIIRGRITGPDSLPVTGAEVKATSLAGAVVKSATTDKSGRFTIIFLNGEGDYWIDVRKLGLAPKHYELKKIGDEEVMIADTRMQSNIAALDAVNVTAQRDRALPNRNSNPDVGGGERPLTNNITVAPDQAGNLAAMAAAVAGIQLVPGLDGASDMFSVLGLTGDQNNTTFNGLGSAINILPPDILATTSIVPYSFDPAIGGFSGAQVLVRTLPGSNFSRRSMSSVEIAPSLEWADATSAAQGQKYTSARLGGNLAGPIVLDQLFYNAAYNVSRRFADARTLFNTDPFGLTSAGIAPDSVSRLRSILGQNGVPLGGLGVPTLHAQDLVQFVTNFDYMPSSSGAGNSFVFAAAGNYQRAEPVSRGGLLLTAPTHAGEIGTKSGNLSIVHSNYFGFGILAKTTLGLAASSQSTTPYVQLPEGIVRVGSTLSDGTSSVKPLFFGGTSALSSLTDATIQLANQMSWFSADNRHTIKIATSIARDQFNSDATQSALGTYNFNSLADLAANAPSSYTRTLTPRSQSGAQVVGSASLGDYWRPTENVQVQYGLRVDGNRFLSRPAFDQPVLDLLGARNDVVPNDVYVTPRVGVQWYYGKAPTIAYAPGAARPPRGVVHAGVGIFQNIGSSQLIAPATLATGLASSAQSVTCVGSAVPFPTWSEFLTDPATIPSRCADGSSANLANSSPNVVLFDRNFRQPKSIRGAGDWSGPIFDNRYVFGVQGIISAGLNQPGTYDVNFNPTVRFSLANEGGRPVFADPSAIVQGTGSIGAGASRVSPSFQRVAVERSDLRVDARQLTINVKPVTANPFLKWDLTYTLLDRYERVRGFANTAGDPRDAFWSPVLPGGKHTVQLIWSDVPVFDLFYLSTGIVAMSGQRYTPMVAGDVNGDGLANDRAFVFDPSLTSDPATASAMRALLSTGTSSARECLMRQLNALASRASCRGPWTANGRVQLKFNATKIGLPKRLVVSLDVQNPLALADIVAHGANDVHGWGQNITPDQNLLFVRGFDPVKQQFLYDVNQRFGSTRPQQSTTHALPFLSLTFALDIGLPRERQLLTQRLDMGRGRPGTKQSAESLKLLGTTTIPNPMNMILQQQDTLKLTRKQADSLATLSYKFSLFADSVWTPSSNYFAGLPESYSTGDAYRSYVSARERTIDFLLTLVPSAKDVLTPAQRRRLPPQISNYLDERVLRFLRSSSSGDNSALIR